VFDTAFHQAMPPRAFRYAVPEEWYTRYGVRRYGFHGTSHRFVSQRAADLLGRPLGELRLAGQAGLTAAELTRELNEASGLAGLSGAGNDMRAVEAAAAAGDERARLALEVFVHRLAKAVAGMVVGLERLDALVFTGGIGEKSVTVRSQVLARLAFLALVMPTDEELMIARDAARLIAADAGTGRHR
jgi:acetate kinase